MFKFWTRPMMATVAALGLFSGAALAQDAPAAEADAAPAPARAMVDDGGAAPAPMAVAGSNAGSAVSFSAGMDYTSNYVWRGYYQGNHGIIVQPWAGLGLTFDSLMPEMVTGYVSDISFNVSTWNDVASKPTGPVQPKNWYESDLTLSTSATVMEQVSVDFGWIGYFYPSKGGDVQEIYLSVGWDDAWVWENMLDGFQLNPYVMVAQTTFNPGGKYGTYYELGMAPSYTFDQLPIAITLETPVKLGLGSGRFYQKKDGAETMFGFFSFGAFASTELTMVPEQFGSWSASTGVDFILTDKQLVGNRNDLEIVFMMGVGMEY